MRREGLHIELTRPRRRPLAPLLALSALLLAPPGAAGQGFAIHGQSACVLGRGGAGVAAPCGDGSSLLFSPAGLVEARELTMSLGGLTRYPRGGFDSDLAGADGELDEEGVTLAHAYVVFPAGERFAGGIGFYSPYDLETSWPLDFTGRFVGYATRLQTLYFQGMVAAEVTEWLSVGAGPLLALSSVELNRRLDLFHQPVPAELGAPPGSAFGDFGVPRGTDFVDAILDSDDAVGFGGAAGILIRPHPTVRVGARYLSTVSMDYEGFAGFQPVETGVELPAGNALGLPAGTSVDSLLEASGLFLTGGPFSGQEVIFPLDLPAQLVAGVAFEPVEGLLLTADYQRTLWSDVDRVPLDFANETTPDDELVLRYDDTNGFRVGAEYSLLPVLALRGGYGYSEEASPPPSVTPILPEGARSYLTAGLGWRATDQIRLDLAYQYLSQQDRRGRVRNPPPGEDPTVQLNEGTYTFDAQFLSASLSWRFP